MLSSSDWRGSVYSSNLCNFPIPTKDMVCAPGVSPREITIGVLAFILEARLAWAAVSREA